MGVIKGCSDVVNRLATLPLNYAITLSIFIAFIANFVVKIAGIVALEGSKGGRRNWI